MAPARPSRRRPAAGTRYPDFAFSCSDVESLITARHAWWRSASSSGAAGSGADGGNRRIAPSPRTLAVVDAAQAVGSLRVDVTALGADVIAAHTDKFLLSGVGLAVCACARRAPSRSYAGRTWAVLDSGRGRARAEHSQFQQPGRPRRGPGPSAADRAGRHRSAHRRADPDDRDRDDGARVARHLTAGREPDISARLGHTSASRPRGRAAAPARPPGLRAVRQNALRISPHAYNTPEDVEQLLAHLPGVNTRNKRGRSRVESVVRHDVLFSPSR